MNTDFELYDLVLKGGWVIDPSQSLEGRFDIAIRDDRIVALAADLPSYQAKQTVKVDGLLVCPGFIDLHTHVYEWISDFGLCPDDAGIHSGVTTVVDQGSCGSRTFPDFKERIVAKAQTDVRSFPLVNQAQVQKAGREIISDLLDPEMADREALVDLAKKETSVIRGFKVFVESGTLSRWGFNSIQLAREIGDRTGLPLYVHTGELFPVIETNRPSSGQVVKDAISFLKAGDILAHCYSYQADGIMGNHAVVPKHLIEAIDKGILLDLGHGQHFSFEIARRSIAQGVLPHTSSSDVHGDFSSPHNDSTLDYSLCGSLSKLIALGLDLETAIASVTIHPARVLRAESEIGTLKIGSLADITVIDLMDGEWLFHDSLGKQLSTKQQLVPTWVVRSGKLIKPNCRLLRDLHVAHSLT
jgi:dihydroorotase